MKSNAERFIERIEEIFGADYSIKRVHAVDGGPPIHLFIYDNLPEEGMMTFITYGLSEGDHPEWRAGKPELILSLETRDSSWGQAIAFFASEFRGSKKFSYGDMFTLDEPISSESEMSGFFVFAPAGLDKEFQKIDLPGKPIFLAGMYPIYKEEVLLYQEIGLKEFWHSEGFDLYNVKRKNLALKGNT